MPQHEPKMQHVHLFVICICRSQVWRKSILYSVGNFLGLGRVNQFADFPTGSVVKGFPCGSLGKESTCNAGDLGTIPGLGISPTEGKGYPLQYSGLENSMDCIVHGVAKSQKQLSNFHFHIHELIIDFSF